VGAAAGVRILIGRGGSDPAPACDRLTGPSQPADHVCGPRRCCSGADLVEVLGHSPTTITRHHPIVGMTPHRGKDRRTMVARMVKRVAAGLIGTAIAIVAAATPASAAYSYEWDNGVAVNGLGTEQSSCVTTSYSEVCIQPYGDKIFVKDFSSADHASAVARWFTDYGRWGTCRNSLGVGHWAVCNKDFKEGSYLTTRATQYDGDTDSWWGPESGDLTVLM
jgi:hypothetical protein